MSRVLAIGDIHGCSAAFDALLAVVRPSPVDLVITLGDYVHRGPDTPGVLDRLIALHRTHGLSRCAGITTRCSWRYTRISRTRCRPPTFTFSNSPAAIGTNGIAPVRARECRPGTGLDHQSLRMLRWEKLYGHNGCPPAQKRQDARVRTLVAKEWRTPEPGVRGLHRLRTATAAAG